MGGRGWRAVFHSCLMKAVIHPPAKQLNPKEIQASSEIVTEVSSVCCACKNPTETKKSMSRVEPFVWCCYCWWPDNAPVAPTSLHGPLFILEGPITLSQSVTDVVNCPFACLYHKKYLCSVKKSLFTTPVPCYLFLPRIVPFEGVRLFQRANSCWRQTRADMALKRGQAGLFLMSLSSSKPIPHSLMRWCVLLAQDKLDYRSVLKLKKHQ